MGMSTAQLARLVTAPIAQAESQSPPDHGYRRRCLKCDLCNRCKPSCRQTYRMILTGAAFWSALFEEHQTDSYRPEI